MESNKLTTAVWRQEGPPYLHRATGCSHQETTKYYKNDINISVSVIGEQTVKPVKQSRVTELLGYCYRTEKPLKSSTHTGEER